MASIEQTATGFAVKWRIGGKRSGAPQTLTLRIPEGYKPDGTRKLALAAKQLAEYSALLLKAKDADPKPTTGSGAAPTRTTNDAAVSSTASRPSVCREDATVRLGCPPRLRPGAGLPTKSGPG